MIVFRRDLTNCIVLHLFPVLAVPRECLAPVLDPQVALDRTVACGLARGLAAVVEHTGLDALLGETVAKAL